jgi:hypothetical protein
MFVLVPEKLTTKYESIQWFWNQLPYSTSLEHQNQSSFCISISERVKNYKKEVVVSDFVFPKMPTNIGTRNTAHISKRALSFLEKIFSISRIDMKSLFVKSIICELCVFYVNSAYYFHLDTLKLKPRTKNKIFHVWAEFLM